MRLKYNILANFIGRFWVMGVGIIFVPVYIKFIGIESYGLLGIFTVIQTIVSLLDMGLTTTLNRELARHAAIKGEEQYMNDLVRTLEIIYIGISFAIGVILVISSFFLLGHWVKPDVLDQKTIISAFILMAVNFCFQLPWGLYEGGLMGLQKQVLLNTINIILATLRAPGAVLILWLISPTIHAFLVWQILINIVQLVLLRHFLWKQLPKPLSKPSFNKIVIKRSGKFALGIMATSFLVILLTQTDKIVLSRTVLLSQFGYYALAASAASLLSIIIMPVAQAIFPRITELHARQDDPGVKKLFHTASQLIAALVLPLGAGVFIFANEILLFWTGNTAIAEHAGPVLQFLILGNMINSLMTIPFQYTQSVGWTRFGINISIVALLFFFPLILWAANRYGIRGGAIMWMSLNTGFLIFGMAYLFSNILKTEKWYWYFNDVIKPSIICIAFAIPFFIIQKYYQPSTHFSILLCAGCVLTCFTATLLLGTSVLKPELKRFLKLFGIQTRLS